jgi:NAD(P)H dehydrogenase (quinone)
VAARVENSLTMPLANNNMQALVIVAHPSPTSLSHAMAQAACDALRLKGIEPWLHDLYAESFNPVQPTGESQNTASSDPLVEQHCAELAKADVVVICHPNWWGQPPAILKGWVDRVFRLDTAYAYPPGEGFDGVPVGKLRARVALVFNTSNTPADREAAVFGDPLERLWRDCIFGLCGVKHVVRHCFGPVAGSSPEARAGWLQAVSHTVAQHAGADVHALAQQPSQTHTPVHYREATEQDLAAICVLGEAVNALHHRHEPHVFAEPGDPMRHAAHWRSTIAQANATTWVAETSAGVVGFVSVVVGTDDHTLLQPVRFARVGTVGVAPGHRGLGIGSQLMAMAQAWGQGRGATEVRLTVGSFNDDANRWYQTLGYRVRASQLVKALPVALPDASGSATLLR